MNLPLRFAEKLRTSDGLNGYVLSTLSAFEPWLNRNDLTFFKEFTDHGSDHIEQVLATIDWLIPDESWSLVTPEDVAVLTLSTLVHDIGMHLQPDGFLALLEETRVLRQHGDRAWRETYDIFLTKALRYNGQTLRAIFGSDLPVTRPGHDPEEWTNRDRRLIGEFLRQHHHRLAHEIALYGVPGPTEDRLQFAAPPTGYDYLPDFIGLTARSHGVSLRTVIDTIEPADQRQDRNVHLPYLMALLRVGDYLQIQAQRAPAAQRKVTHLRSPLSQDEWDKHDAIENMRLDSDINALYVKAAPKSAKIFVKLTQLLSGIQREIDTSWAVIGEQYSRFDEFKALGLRLRRIKSNLDDVATFAEKVSYIPEQVRFEAADADLLNLLTAPLYGHRPEIGVRELVQNAVDACRELRFYLEQRHLPAPQQASQVADVNLRFRANSNGGGGTVTVQDKGVGMSIDTVKNYFLKAGASFRKSPLWRETYLDEAGSAQVLRAGRFGIGVLAAFLLGRELTVTTRYVNDARGIRFSCTIDSDFIELERVDVPVGTTVEVQVAQDVWASLNEDRAKADWYCLQSPSLRITWDGERYEQKHRLPAYGTEPSQPWSQLRSEEYGEVQWSLTTSTAPRLSATASGSTRRRGNHTPSSSQSFLHRRRTTRSGSLLPYPNYPYLILMRRCHSTSNVTGSTTPNSPSAKRSLKKL